MENGSMKMVYQHRIINRLLMTSTVWGRVPTNPLQVTNAFSNEPDDRPYQDVGYDGLTDTAEQRKFAPYLSAIRSAISSISVSKD